MPQDPLSSPPSSSASPLQLLPLQQQQQLSPPAPEPTTPSTGAFPQPLSFERSPSAVRKKGPSLALLPSSSGDVQLQQRPHSARPAFMLDRAALPSPTTPTALAVSSPTRRAHARTHSTDGPPSQTPTTARQLYSTAVPSRQRDESPPGSSSSSSSSGAAATGALPARIPKEFVLRKLRQLAPLYWQDLASADCTVLLRLPTTHNVAAPANLASPQTPPHTAQLNQPRRASLPSSNEITVLTYKLHREYLSTQSSLFRRLLSSNLTPSSLPDTPSPPRPAGRARARLVPAMSRDAHPCLLLDLPDVTSFNLAVHWMYWGDFAIVERALVAKQVDWKLLFNCIEILGLEKELKIACSRFWRKWIKPSNGPSIASLAAAAAVASARPGALDSPPSSASSGASTVVGASHGPRPSSRWPTAEPVHQPLKSHATAPPAVAPSCPASNDDDDDDDGGGGGDPPQSPPCVAGGGWMDDVEDFPAFEARVGRSQAPADDAALALAADLGALGRPVCPA